MGVGQLKFELYAVKFGSAGCDSLHKCFVYVLDIYHQIRWSSQSLPLLLHDPVIEWINFFGSGP